MRYEQMLNEVLLVGDKQIRFKLSMLLLGVEMTMRFLLRILLFPVDDVE